MDIAPIPLPTELRAAINSHGSEPLTLWDEQSQKSYWLVERESQPPLEVEYLRRLAAPGLEDEQNGEIALLDVEAVIRQAKQLFGERTGRTGA